MPNPPSARIMLRNVLGDDGDSDFKEPFINYVERIFQTRWELMRLRQEITQVPLTLTGYPTHQELEEKEADFQELSQTVENIHDGMVTSNVGAVDGVKGSGPASNQLLDYINEGTISTEVERLEQTMAQVGQQIESKKNTANSRMVLVASSLAALAAAGSLLVTAIQIAL